MKIFDYKKAPSGSLPAYETVLQQVSALLELGLEFRTRFVDVFQAYLKSLDDPHREKRLHYLAERVTARAEGKEPPAPPVGYDPHILGGIPEGPIPSKEQAEVMITLDETLMAARHQSAEGRQFTESIVNIIRDYNALSPSLPASDRYGYLDNKLKELYKAH